MLQWAANLEPVETRELALPEAPHAAVARYRPQPAAVRAPGSCRRAYFLSVLRNWGATTTSSSGFAAPSANAAEYRGGEP
jgi:hypothetical protein